MGKTSQQTSMSKLLGILNYFRKFIPFYPDLTEQFTSLLHGEFPEWQWTDELEEKYKKIYLILANSFYYNKMESKLPIYMQTDASII